MSIDLASLILAGGRGSRLNLIASRRAKPAVPFAGMYRIIDFTLSNLMLSGAHHVGVLTQYRPTSLMEHLGDGEAWDMQGHNACLKILPPSLGSTESDWYKGTADAVYQNLTFLDDLDPKNVALLSGDHIYHMDYRPMIASHMASGADLTIAAMEVPWEDTSRFGVMVTQPGPDGVEAVTRFVEKSPDRISNLANMGIYLFRYDTLREELMATVRQGGYDFGANVIPAMLSRRRVQAYRFSGYWRDVGTLGSYWMANMDALSPASGLDLSAWKVCSNLSGRGQVYHPPAWFGDHASVAGSLVSRGSVIEGTVTDSVLSPGVHVGVGARVTASVIMHDCHIEAGASVSFAIVDKDVTIGAGACIGRPEITPGVNRRFPTHLSGGITVVGKGTHVPDGLVVGANCLIGEGLQTTDFPAAKVADGECVLPDA